MLESFIATLNPILSLFICIAIGFALKKLNLIGDEAGSVMAKMETWVFCPALSFITMARFFTVDTVVAHSANLIVSVFSIALLIGCGYLFSRLLIRKRCYERGVYAYALAFANCGYFGDPVVLSLFGEAALAYYKVYTLPISIAIYTWGLSNLVPSGGKGGTLKKILNPPTVATFIGMAAGLIFPKFDAVCPEAITGVFDTLKACMGPVAMLLAGFTIAKYDVVGMLKEKKVYVATALRLILIPLAAIPIIYSFKELMNLTGIFNINNSVLFLAFFTVAGPLGLNTVVFPEAYGENPKTGASMAMISHTLCIITVPLMMTLLEAVFGGFAL